MIINEYILSHDMISMETLNRQKQKNNNNERIIETLLEFQNFSSSTPHY